MVLLSIVFGYLHEMMIMAAQNSGSRDFNAGTVERNVFQVEVICVFVVSQWIPCDLDILSRGAGSLKRNRVVVTTK